MQIICLSSDKNQKCLPAFMRLWAKYFGTEYECTIFGYTRPPYEVKWPFHFSSLGAWKDYPFHKWSNGLLKVLNDAADKTFLFVLEDYFLIRKADLVGIKYAYEFMRNNQNYIRFDLTRDRAQTEGVEFMHHLGHLDLVLSRSWLPYNFSYQAAIYNRDALLKIIEPNESAGESEIMSNERLKGYPFQVVGTRQAPLKYNIAIQQGKLALDGGYQGSEYAVNMSDLLEFGTRGIIEGLAQ